MVSLLFWLRHYCNLRNYNVKLTIPSSRNFTISCNFRRLFTGSVTIP